MKGKNIGFVVAIIILSGLLVVSIVMGMTGFFCQFSAQKFVTDLQVGEIANINVFAGETSVLSLSFDGAILPREKIPFTLQISSPETEKDIIFRVKSNIFGLKTEDKIGFVVGEKFSLEDDGYYYFNNTLRGGDKVTFCESVILPKNNSLSCENRYIVTISVETLDAELDSNVIWKNNI